MEMVKGTDIDMDKVLEKDWEMEMETKMERRSN